MTMEKTVVTPIRKKEDFPIKCPCDACGLTKWKECYAKRLACDNLWKWLAMRGNWVMKGTY